MADRAQQLEALVREVTQAVLAQLAAGATGPDAWRGKALILLPVPPARPDALAGLAEEARRLGFGVETLPGLDAGAAAAALGALQPGDVVVVGSLGFAWARRLVELDDGEPGVRLVLGALLAGRPVLAASDGLSAGPAVRGRVAERAHELLRELIALGLGLRPLAELGASLAGLRAGRDTGGRALGGLLGEADVEALHRAGERRVRLARGCLVTPLARTRAAELGLELIEQEGSP
ncbi:MAG TPA: hypothetical protein PK668_10455 [Myxococcota bacterium]|nr:hypothetical protein [Myxococcota bacterium]HRY93417.1 hypothetical protein [Myxococcota bacterium]HSA21322.1 hypothetical protein [Myxococcota bacterium]